MTKLEDFKPSQTVQDILPRRPFTFVGNQRFGTSAVMLHLPFGILANRMLEAARTGNRFLEHNLVVAHLDKLDRSPNVQGA